MISTKRLLALVKNVVPVDGGWIVYFLDPPEGPLDTTDATDEACTAAVGAPGRHVQAQYMVDGLRVWVASGDTIDCGAGIYHPDVWYPPDETPTETKSEVDGGMGLLGLLVDAETTP